MKTKIFNKLKNIFKGKQKQSANEKIAVLEQRISGLEKANLVILSRLLQMGSTSNKVAEKSSVLFSAPKDCNEGKNPTYH